MSSLVSNYSHKYPDTLFHEWKTCQSSRGMMHVCAMWMSVLCFSCVYELWKADRCACLRHLWPPCRSWGGRQQTTPSRAAPGQGPHGCRGLASLWSKVSSCWPSTHTRTWVETHAGADKLKWSLKYRLNCLTHLGIIVKFIFMVMVQQKEKTMQYYEHYYVVCGGSPG